MKLIYHSGEGALGYEVEQPIYTIRIRLRRLIEGIDAMPPRTDMDLSIDLMMDSRFPIVIWDYMDRVRLLNSEVHMSGYASLEWAKAWAIACLKDPDRFEENFSTVMWNLTNIMEPVNIKRILLTTMGDVSEIPDGILHVTKARF